MSRHCSEWPDEESKTLRVESHLAKNHNFHKQKQGLDQSDNSWINAITVCFCHVLAATAGELFRVAGPEVFLSNRLQVDVHEISEIIRFELTYWKVPSSFLVQPMRYRATSGAPCSQVATKLVWVTSENRRFLGAGTTSADWQVRRGYSHTRNMQLR